MQPDAHRNAAARGHTAPVNQPALYRAAAADNETAITIRADTAGLLTGTQPAGPPADTRCGAGRQFVAECGSSPIGLLGRSQQANA